MRGDAGRVRARASARAGRVAGRVRAGAGRVLGRLAGRLGVAVWEVASIAGIILLGAVLRFANLPLRGGWDSDQGTEMLALRAAISGGQLPTFGPEAISVGGTFHHGALYYDLLLPAAWLGNGDPVWVVAEIALLSLLVIPIVWWIARTIGGPAAGITAGLLAACSASLIGYSTFIWNPTLVEPGAALAFLGAWQALRTDRPAWWVVAAAGTAVAAQCHVAAGAIALPLAAAYLYDLLRGHSPRARTLAWGFAGAALVVATYLPLIAWELNHNFSDTRGMLDYLSRPGTGPSVSPLARLVMATIRILAWPLTRWPLFDLRSGLSLAFLVATALSAGLVWRSVDTMTRRSATRLHLPDPEPVERREAIMRLGTLVVGWWLLLIIVPLGLGLHAVSDLQVLQTEQYHVIADPLVFVAAGLIVGGMWQSLARPKLGIARRVVAVAAVAGILVWNAGHWPPLTSPDGGWPAAQSAAQRLQADAGGTSMALVPLFVEKGGDAYIYPLTRDGVVLVSPDRASIVVVLCDTYWQNGCGGPAEETWLNTSAPPGTFTQIDRFNAAPDRILTVYRRTP